MIVILDPACKQLTPLGYSLSAIPMNDDIDRLSNTVLPVEAVLVSFKQQMRDNVAFWELIFCLSGQARPLNSFAICQ